MIDENFINEWIKHQIETLDDEDSELHWTDNYLIDLMLKREVSELWEFVMRTYRRNLTQEVIDILSAGPLEDILAAKGDEYIGRVEVLAVNDKKFRYLLGGVWQNSMSDEVWSKVRAAREEW